MKGRSRSEGELPGWLMSISAKSLRLDGSGWVTRRGKSERRSCPGHRWPWEPRRRATTGLQSCEPSTAPPSVRLQWKLRGGGFTSPLTRWSYTDRQTNSDNNTRVYYVLTRTFTDLPHWQWTVYYCTWQTSELNDDDKHVGQHLYVNYSIFSSLLVYHLFY